MTSSSEMRKINNMFRVIQNKGEIHQWDLVEESKVSIRDYQNLRGFLLHKYGDKIMFDRKLQTWYLIQYKQLKEEEMLKINDTS